MEVFTARSFTLVVVACVLMLAACAQAETLTARADRAAKPTVAPEPTVAPSVPAATPEPDDDPATGDDAETTPPETAEPLGDNSVEPETADAVVPRDLCVQATGDIVSGLIAWTDLALDKTWTPSDADVYVNSTGNPGRSFVDGELRCSITFDDGATLEISAASNYDRRNFLGSRLPNDSASSVEILVAVEPETARAVVEYPWAPSPTGEASVIIALNDPAGIEAAEVRAVEAVAVRIRDEVLFVPPEVQGPAYPDWYVCTASQFASLQGATGALATAIGQPAGLHARETIDRGFGTAQCELSAGPGTNSSGQPALGSIRISLAAYESDSPSFDQTVQGVLSQAGVVQGQLVVGDSTYTKISGQSSVAVLIESQGRAVISAFDTAGTATPAELETLLTKVLAELF